MAAAASLVLALASLDWAPSGKDVSQGEKWPRVLLREC